MSLDRQLLFLFSALGAFNGLFLSVYFAFFSTSKKRSNYFLSALLLVLSVRILKSTFFYFNPKLSQVYIQIGLSACALIGPLLYIYIHDLKDSAKGYGWLLHVVPVSVIIYMLGYYYPYWEYKKMWSSYIVKGIYLQWFMYIIGAGFLLRNTFKKLIMNNEKLKEVEFWILSIFTGVTIILFSYSIASYTSYIVGAVSFSVVFYLIILFLVFKKKRASDFYENPIKYADKKITEEEAELFYLKLDNFIKQEQFYKKTNFKLTDLAKKLNVSTHYISQFLNDNLGKSYASFINEYRIDNAKELLRTNSSYTIEVIGYESGFNSKSTFFTTFKKVTGLTPSKYKDINGL